MSEDLDLRDLFNFLSYDQARNTFLKSLPQPETFMESSTYPFGLVLFQDGATVPVPEIDGTAWGGIVCQADETCHLVHRILAKSAANITTREAMKKTVFFHYLAHLYNLQNVEKCKLPDPLPSNVSMISLIENVLRKCFFCNREAALSDEEMMPGYSFIICDCNFRTEAASQKVKSCVSKRTLANTNEYKPDFSFDFVNGFTDDLSSMFHYEKMLMREMIFSPRIHWHELGMGIAFAVFRARNVRLTILTKCALTPPAFFPNVTTPKSIAVRDVQDFRKDHSVTQKCEELLNDGENVEDASIKSFFNRDFLTHDVQNNFSSFFKYDYQEEPLFISHFPPDPFFFHCRHDAHLWVSQIEEMKKRAFHHNDFPPPIPLHRMAFMKVLILILRQLESAPDVERSRLMADDFLPRRYLSLLRATLREAEKNKRFRLQLILQLEASFFPSEHQSFLSEFMRNDLKPPSHHVEASP